MNNNLQIVRCKRNKENVIDLGLMFNYAIDMDLLFKHAIAKWKWITKNWKYNIFNEENYARLLASLPYLAEYIGYCSFCESFNYSGRSTCVQQCPLFQIGEGCKTPNSLYTIWRTSIAGGRIDKAQTAAKRLLALIKRLSSEFKLKAKTTNKGVERGGGINDGK